MVDRKTAILDSRLIVLSLIFCLLSFTFSSASTTYVWNLESLLTSGTLSGNIQINLDNTGTCDAKTFSISGYDYPGLSVNALLTCERCAGAGTDGIGDTSDVPSGQDTFSDCTGVDCSGYYIQTGTESASATEYCYDRANEPDSTHYCDGSGSCYSAVSVCSSNSVDTQKYSCGTCRYISSSSCTGTTLGSCSNYGAGTDTGVCRECNGSGGEQASSDDSGCGTIDCDGLNYYSQSGTQSATTTETCYYRNYADITSNRCEGLGDCKDANSGDCASYSDQSQYTCSTCKYISASSCTGGTIGSCSNYGAGTDTGTCRECDGSGGEQASSDDSGCGTIDCDGLNFYSQSGTQSATTTETCYYRNYADITSNRCEGLGDCKDANSGDCTSYSNQNQYSCGTCRYISGSSCTGGTQGSCSNYGAGIDTGTCRECDGSGGEQASSDDSGCGTIDCDGLNYYYQSGTQSATTTETCYYRNYADITSNRCEGLGDCKDANSGDCTSYSNQNQYSCGTCKYISGSSCTGGTQGSCSNYGSGTSCGPCKVCDGSGNCVNSPNTYYGANEYGCEGSPMSVADSNSKRCYNGVCRTCSGLISMVGGQRYIYGPVCWFEGQLGQSCTTVCSSHGGNFGIDIWDDDTSCTICRGYHPGALCFASGPSTSAPNHAQTYGGNINVCFFSSYYSHVTYSAVPPSTRRRQCVCNY